MMVAFLLAILLLLCGCTSGVMFATRDKDDEPTAPGPEARNPYYKTVSRCACCSWQCGFLFTMLAFFLGGIILLVTVPVSGLCLVLDEMDRPLLEGIAGSLGLQLTGDEGGMLLDIAEQCILAPTGTTANPNMFDILYTRENATAPKVYMREKLIGAIRSPIDAQFAKIRSTVEGSSMNMSSNEGVVSLRALFELNDVRGLVVADAGAMQSSNILSGLVADSRAVGITVGYAASALCADLAVQGDLGGLSGTIPGVDTFVTLLTHFGPIVPESTCAKQVVCPVAISAARTACEAGNAYIDIKRQVWGAAYRCDVFADPTDPSAFCDPKDMVQEAGGTWRNDCIKTDGTMSVKARACTFTDFAAYVKEHDVRLEKIMQRLDAAVQEALDDIVDGLQALVQKQVLGDIDNMTAGVTCGFLPEAYRASIDAICFQSLIGFRRLANSYVSCAIITILLMVLMYGTWRWQIDNVNEWDHAHLVTMTQVVPVDPSETAETA